MPEEVARFTVLLEDIQTQVRVIADGHVGLCERMDRMDARLGRLETRFDGLELRFDSLECRFEGFAADTSRRFEALERKFEGFAGFAADTSQRLERIEAHLAGDGPPRRRAPTRRNRKKPAKPS